MWHRPAHCCAALLQLLAPLPPHSALSACLPAENATDPFRMSLHLAGKAGAVTRAEQRELLAELMASKAVQSQIPYW